MQQFTCSLGCYSQIFQNKSAASKAKYSQVVKVQFCLSSIVNIVFKNTY